jgi:hypothetical protein
MKIFKKDFAQQIAEIKKIKQDNKKLKKNINMNAV